MLVVNGGKCSNRRECYDVCSTGVIHEHRERDLQIDKAVTEA